MAYNNYFPMGYQQQQYYPQQMYNPQPQQSVNQQAQSSQQTNSSIIWVQGEAGAKSYLVAPNTTVQLWDSENQVIYLKSADASGMPSMKVLDYKIREAAQPVQQTQITSQPMQDYVTKTEFGAFEDKINAKFAEIMQKGEIKDGEPTV